MSKLIYLYNLLFLILLVSSGSLFSQEIDKVTKKNSFKTSGGISASTVFYGANGIENRRDPFYWQINANLNFNILGVSVPFSASFSQQERSFTQPFNQYGLSPKYKSVQVHLGYRSLNFSPYTLGGRTFLGAGVEIKPKKSKIQASLLYGRFARAVQEGGNDGTVVGIPTYERWGYGTKIRYGNEKSNIAGMFFRGRDVASSINRDLLTEELLPEENLVWGLTTKQKLGKKVMFDFEYAFSAYTRNTLNNEVILQNFSYYNNLGNLITPNATTQFNKAINSNLTFTQKKYNVQVSYRRIDPEYQTMGSPFLNNDLEEIKGAVSWKMNKSKINVTTTGGFQRNNLDQQEIARVVRAVTGVNVAYTVSKKLNLNANFSNFNTSTNKVQFINIDSIEYFQVTNNVSFGANYKLGNNKKVRHTVLGNTSFQKAFDSEKNNTNINNTNIGYQLSLLAIKLNLGAFVNYNINQFQDVNSTNLGPSLTVGKSLLKKKLQSSFTFSSLQIATEKVVQNVVQNYQLQLRYSLKKKHSLSLIGILLNRNDKTGIQNSFSERRVTLQYGYRF